MNLKNSFIDWTSKALIYVTQTGAQFVLSLIGEQQWGTTVAIKRKFYVYGCMSLAYAYLSHALFSIKIGHSKSANAGFIPSIRRFTVLLISV